MDVQMVNVGDVFYNWRYGPLKVVSVGELIYTEILDKDGIVAFDKPDFRPQFSMDSIGSWIHYDKEDAILLNRLTSEQKDRIAKGEIKPLFPINGKLIHKQFASTINDINSKLSKSPDVLKAQQRINELERTIEGIEDEYKSYKNACKKAVDEIFKVDFKAIIQNLINERPTDKALKDKYKNDDEYYAKNNENQAYLKILNYLSANLSKKGIDLKACEDFVKRQSKNEFSNDSAYKEFTVLVEETTKLLGAKLKDSEEKVKSLLNQIKNIMPSKKLAVIIDSQSVYAVDKNIVKEINDCLDDEMIANKEKYENELKPLRNLVKYSNIKNPNYITI